MRRFGLLLTFGLLACQPKADVAEAPLAAPTAAPTPEPTAAPLNATDSSDAGASAAEVPAAPKKVIPFTHDDFPAAVQRAKASGKAVFVDVWAEWCHTCLSMQSYVYTDTSLELLSTKAEFVEVDYEKDVNADFLAKYPVNVWPTLFMIDPNDGAVLGMWPGAASARELKRFVEESLSAFDQRRQGKLPADSPLGLLVAAKAAEVKRNSRVAIRNYEKLLKTAPADWPRRSEALLGYLMSLTGGAKWGQCVKVGADRLAEVQGAAIPADFSRVYQRCVQKLRTKEQRIPHLKRIAQRLHELTDRPAEGASPDDVSDALSILADVEASLGNKDGFVAAHRKRLALLEKAAQAAPTPQIAQTHDYDRANAYLTLGQPEKAIAMLEEREKQLPDSYEPSARLASVLSRLGRFEEALAAVDRALPKSYGPRRLGYLSLKARIQTRLGDLPGVVKTLEERVAGYEKLTAGQANKEGLDAAKKELEKAKAKLPR